MKREMVLIEGGTFIMGSNNAGKEQKGEHPVTVPSFYLDKYEVTNAEYAEFIKATGKPAPEIDPAVKESYWQPWNGNNPPSGRERWPVANVSPKDVEAFAAWLSKRDGVVYRLPTEEEWEFAARNGSRNSLFPWGNSWEEGRANINEEKSPVAVGSFPARRDSERSTRHDWQRVGMDVVETTFLRQHTRPIRCCKCSCAKRWFILRED